MRDIVRPRILVPGLILLILLFASFVPILMMLSMSLRSTLAIYTDFFGWPWPPEWTNYVYAFGSLIGPTLRTVYVCLVSVGGILLFGSLAGYAFARLQFFGKRVLYWAIIAMMTIPGVVLLTPNFILASWLGLRNSLTGLIIFYIGGGLLFAIFLLRTFFQSLPEELFEAARMEGASEWHALWRIAIPLSRPILITISILNFLSIYNDLMWPLLMLANPNLQTLAMALVSFSPQPNSTIAGAFSQPQLGIIAGGYVLASIPLVIVFVFGMKYFIQGLTSGAIKT